MDKKYEITIRELTPFTEEDELKNVQRRNDFNLDRDFRGYSDKSFHEVRVLFAEVSKEEFESVKKAIVGVL